MAEATDITNPSRRLFVTGASAVVGLVGVPAAMSRGGSDAALIALVERYFQAAQVHDAASEYADNLYGTFCERLLSKPQALRHRHITDPHQIGWTMEYLPNKKCRTWCDVADIEKMRGVPITRKEAVDPSSIGMADALPGVEFIWKDVPWPDGQRRYDEILAAHEVHRKAVQAIRDDLGLDAAEAVAEEIEAELRRMAAEIVVTKATTREGLRAKARVVFSAIWLEDAEASEFDTTDCQIMASIVRDLMDLAPRANITLADR